MSTASEHVTALSWLAVNVRRLQFCSAEVQRKWFRCQFDLARDSGLPVFLHMRAAADDMLAILQVVASDFAFCFTSFRLFW